MSKSRKTRDDPRPTLGPWVCAWIEKYLVHSEGDWLGKPFRLIPYHRRLIWRAYELNDDGSRRYYRALWGMPKGNAKTEIGAALALAELAGPVCFDGWKAPGKPRRPVRRIAPDIPVAAASFEQADGLFSSARTMITEGPLAPLFDCYDTEILPKNEAGKIYRVAAVAGTNDGRRPTFFVADELHEWVGNKERVHLVLSNGRVKRQASGAWELAISTAGWDLSSLLGRLYTHGKAVQSGDVEDPSFLFDWAEPQPVLDAETGKYRDYDAEDEGELKAAIRESNPAVGHFLSYEAVRQQFREKPEHEARRYFTNQWTDTPERWLPAGAFESLVDGEALPADGTPIMIGFDGSYSGDSTGIVGCTLEEKPHIFVIAAWEKPESDVYDWRVDVLDVETEFRKACKRWRVERAGCDPYRWQRSLAVLSEEGLPIVEWLTHVPSRMVPACAQFYDGVRDRAFTHDGDERLIAHVGNARVKTDSRGPRIVKEHKDSPKKIDLAVSAVIAYDLRCRHVHTAPSMYANPETAVM